MKKKLLFLIAVFSLFSWQSCKTNEDQVPEKKPIESADKESTVRDTIKAGQPISNLPSLCVDWQKSPASLSYDEFNRTLSKEIATLCAQKNSLTTCNTMKRCRAILAGMNREDPGFTENTQYLCGNFFDCMTQKILPDSMGMGPEPEPEGEQDSGSEENSCGSEENSNVGGTCYHSDDPICGDGEKVCRNGAFRCLPLETMCQIGETSCYGVFNGKGRITDIAFGPPTYDFNYYSYDSYFALASFDQPYISLWAQHNTQARDNYYAQIPVPKGSFALATTSLNNDGNLHDLLATNILTNSIYPFLVTPNPFSYTALDPLPTGQKPVSLAPGDLDRDGYNDIVVVEQDDNTVSVFLSDESSGFLPRVSYPVGQRPTDVALADINNDNFLDILVSNFTSETVSVLINNGDGSFSPRRDYPAGFRPTALAVGDLNNSNGPDVVVTDGGNQSTNSVAVLYNDGTGNFNGPDFYPTGESPTDIIIIDFNKDSYSDLVTSNAFGKDISILLGQASGGFGPAQSYGQGLGATKLLAYDYSFDSYLDILVLNPSAHSASFLYNNEDSGIDPNPVPYALNNHFPDHYGTYDFNNDNALDLVNFDTRSGNAIVTLKDTCQNGFSVTSRFGNYFFGPYDVGDINSDGNLDIVVGLNGNPGFAVFYNDGNANFTQTNFSLPSGTPNYISVTYLNDDDYPDLLINTSVYSPLPTGTLNELFNLDGTDFQLQDSLPGGPFAVGNIDEIHGPEPYCAFQSVSTPPGYYKNDNHGNFTAFIPNNTVGMPFDIYKVIDLNGDKAPEVVMVEISNSSFSFFTSVYFNNGFGDFEPTNVSIANLYAITRFADLNNDSFPDTVFAPGSNLLSVYFNDGSGKFENATVIDYPVPYSIFDVFFLDLDHNDYLDIIYYYTDNTNYNFITYFGAIFNPGEYTKK